MDRPADGWSVWPGVSESPTTDRFYHLDRITDAESEDGRDFRENLLARLGIRA